MSLSIGDDAGLTSQTSSSPWGGCRSIRRMMLPERAAPLSPETAAAIGRGHVPNVGDGNLAEVGRRREATAHERSFALAMGCDADDHNHRVGEDQAIGGDCPSRVTLNGRRMASWLRVIEYRLRIAKAKRVRRVGSSKSAGSVVGQKNGILFCLAPNCGRRYPPQGRDRHKYKRGCHEGTTSIGGHHRRWDIDWLLEPSTRWLA